MNKVIEYVLRAKDFVSESLTRISSRFGQAGNEAEKAAKNVEKLGGSPGGGKGAIQVLNDELVKSTGLLGKVGSAMGKFGGTVAAALGSFKLGWDIGTWINENIFGFVSYEEEWDKRLKSAQKKVSETVTNWRENLSELVKAYDEASERAKLEAGDVEASAKAYEHLRSAAEGVIDTKAKLAQTELELQKTRDVAALTASGNSVGASQVSKYYDVLMAEEKAKEELAKFDRNEETAQQKRIFAEKQLSKIEDERIENERKLHALRKERDDIDEKLLNARTGFGAADSKLFDEYKKGLKDIESSISASEQKDWMLQREVESRRSAIDAMDIEMGDSANRRALLQKQLDLEIETKKGAYDEFLQNQEEEEFKAFQELQKKEEEEEQKALEKRVKAELEAEKKAIEEEKRMLQKDLADWAEPTRIAEANLASAKAQVSQAWGWYRNKDAMKAYMDEQKADQEAQKQYLKDFDRLQSRHRDWRTIEMGKLSVEEEATRQVALAKEAEAAAQRALDEINANTAVIKEIYEALTGGE